MELTPVELPERLPFPIVVTKVLVQPKQRVAGTTQLFHYSYTSQEPIPLNERDPDIDYDDANVPTRETTNVSTFECLMRPGVVQEVFVRKNEAIIDNTRPVLEVLEDCTHDIQYGGLCALCGASLEDMPVPSISMDHNSTNLKVSNREAMQIEKGSMKRLLNEKKLSLVVDLDQTVIHVTVDPTVAEWMSDPTNPNYESVKHVKSFYLNEGQSGRWYFCKMRPGLHEFLEKMAKMYELHIYTMATKQYAIEIAKIIDPEGIYFGDRILSRDESGSLTQKSLQRLFPMDTSMVVVIDDRGDVWDWCPNLIKVVPYDFFLGIGDINSSFLPKKVNVVGPSKRRASVSILEEKLLEKQEEEVNDQDSTTNSATSGSTSTQGGQLTQQVSESSGVSGGAVMERMMALNSSMADQEKVRSNKLEQQEHDRPLAQLQKNLDKIIEQQEEGEFQDEEPKKEEAKDSLKENANNQAHNKHIIEPHNLLSDDDKELETLGQALFRIHNEYYYEIDKNGLSNANDFNLKNLPDVKSIMNTMKSLVFQNCTFLLSGILPQNFPLNSADIVIWVKSFGAKVVPDYTKEVTHVICKNPNTLKVRLAKSVDSNVNVVNVDWVFDCMSLWDRVPVDDYVVKVDHLLNRAQVDDWLQFHGNVDPIGNVSEQRNDSKSVQASKEEGEVEEEPSVHASDFNWNELDEEVDEFLGSDEDEDEDEEDQEKENKRELENEDEDNDNKRQKIEAEVDDDDFEAALLADLESLEED